MKSAGFTLVEVLIALSVASIIGVLLVYLLINGNSVFLQQSAKVSQGLNLNDTVSTLNARIKAAAYVASEYPVVSPVYFSSANTLILALPALGLQGQLVESTYDYVVIARDNQKPEILRETVFPDAGSSRPSVGKVLTAKLSKINFTYLDQNGNPVGPAAASRINFTVQVAEASSSSQVSLRNN